MSGGARTGRRAFLVATSWATPARARARDALPRAGLWPAPAPIEPAPALAAALRLAGGLWLARDDLGGASFADGSSIAGGKARKLDLLLGDALARGAKVVATTGGVGSNHARAVAVAARALGLGCRLALLPEPSSATTRRNLAAIERAGATVTIGGRDGVARLAREAQASRGAIAWIPMGGTTPLGDLAFVEAALELADRVRAGAMPEPEALVTALGSGGSAVGLATGLALAGLRTRVVAVRCSSPSTSSEAVLAAELRALVAQRYPGRPDLERAARERLVIDGRQIGGGYGQPTASSARAAAQFAEHGVPLDPTYGAKAASHLAVDPTTRRGGPVVLWIASDARWLAGAQPPAGP